MARGMLGKKNLFGMHEIACLQVQLMDWKLSLWSSVELFEQARSPGRVVRVDQETKVWHHDLNFLTR